MSTPRAHREPRLGAAVRLVAPDLAGPSEARPASASPPAATDLDLLLALLTGDARAWTLFSRRFGGLLFGMVAKTCARSGFWVDADELLDIVQEANLRMIERDFRRLRLYRPDRGSSVSTWVALIATSTAKDYIRRTRSRPAQSGPWEALDGLTDPDPNPEELVLDRHERAQLQARLEGLSARDREFLELYLVEALAPEDVAARMGISVNTVYSKKAKLVARLNARPAAFSR